MSILFLLTCFFGGMLAAVTRGPGVAIGLVYLPVLVLFSGVQRMNVPVVHLVDGPSAVIYGILLGSFFAGRYPRFRVTVIDLLLAALLVINFVSVLDHQILRHTIGQTFIIGTRQGFFAYFAARAWFGGRSSTTSALYVLPACMFVVLVFALIEMRLWPRTYGVILEMVGLTQSTDMFTLARGGLFRAESSFSHPIDLGNGAALAGALYGMLVWRSRSTLTKQMKVFGLKMPFRLMVLGGWLLAAFCAISFSSFMGIGAAMALFVALLASPLSRRLLPLVVVAMIVAGFALTAHLASLPLPEKIAGDNSIQDSLRNRQELMQLSIEIARTAGPLGWGDEVAAMMRYRSVDSAYLLLAMERGWVALCLWLAVPLWLAWMVSRCRGSASLPSVRTVLFGAAAVLGTMVSMFTVFYGFVYAQLFMLVLALTVNEVQVVRRDAASQKRQGVTRRPLERMDSEPIPMPSRRMSR